MMRPKLLAGALAVGIVLLSQTAWGQGGSSEPPKRDEWEFALTLYGWAVGLDGDMTVRGEKADVDESFSCLG